MNRQMTHLESCGWKNVAIHPGLIRQISIDSLDRGWMIPFGTAYLAPQTASVGDERADSSVIDKQLAA